MCPPARPAARYWRLSYRYPFGVLTQQIAIVFFLQRGHLAAVELLLYHHANVDAREDAAVGGAAPVTYAVTNNHLQVVEALCNAGPVAIYFCFCRKHNFTIAQQGANARQPSTERYAQGLSARPSALPCCDRQPSTRCDRGRVTVAPDAHCNMFFCCCFALCFLLPPPRSRCDLGVRDATNGFSLLHVAARLNRVAAGALLVSKGADIHARDTYGYNASYWAKEYGCAEFLAQVPGLPPPAEPSIDEKIALLKLKRSGGKPAGGGGGKKKKKGKKGKKKKGKKKK